MFEHCGSWCKPVQIPEGLCTAKGVGETSPARVGEMENSVLCSTYFAENCFDVIAKLAEQFGIAKKPTLVAGALPTIFSSADDDSIGC